MMSSRLLLALFNLVAVLNYCHSQDDGITIGLKDRVIPNHGLVISEDIELYGTGMNLAGGLKCSTTHTSCCTGSTATRWHYAHARDVITSSNALAFRNSRTSTGAVYLHRNKVLDNPSVTNGIWRCTIPDSNGVEQTKYIGIYSMTEASGSIGRNGTLSARSHGTIQFNMVSEVPVVFTLTFRTTGGPATYVTWTRDGVNISSLGDNCYTPSQTVIPNGNRIYTLGHYDNILTVSGRLSGVYGVSVTNDRTTTPVTATRNILGDGITISLGDRVIPNHGLVTTEDIGVDDTGEDLTVGLKCGTTNTDCCTSNTSTARWYFAHVNMEVPASQDDGPNSFETNRSGQAVYLFRNMDSTTNGIMRCQIPDSNGDLQTKYVGVYSPGTTGALSARSPGTIAIEVSTGSTSEDPVVFTLTFRTTGGPATYVTWTRDGADMCLGDNRYTPSQTVVPNGDRIYTTGDYDNILTVSGRLSGVYGVRVTNDRTTRPFTASIAILDYPQAVLTNGSATQSPTDGDITISWTVSNTSVVSRFFDGYEIQYRISCTSNQQSSCGREPVRTVMVDTTATHYNLTSVTLWVTYDISITLVNISTNRHYFPGISGLHLEGIQVMTRGILAPEITSVSELNNITSVQVTWDQPGGGLAAGGYVVSYRRLNGRDEQCSSIQDEDSVTVMAEGEREPFTATFHLLQVDTVYLCNLTARITDGDLYNTTSFNFTTNSTVPSGAPQNLTIVNSTSTSVTISWDSVECIHRNGLITHYIISYGPVGDTTNQVTEVRVNTTEPDNGGTFMATGLNATKNYMFEVAAVNSDGSGESATISTNKSFQAPEVNMVLALNETSVQITWNQPERGLAADEYVVSYHRLNGRDGQCSSFQDEDSVTVNGVTNTINFNLQAYSVYAVNVTGRNGDIQHTSTIPEVETNLTVPSERPQNLAVMNSTSTSVTISWDSVECIHRNGNITHYIISYGQGEDGETDNQMVNITVNGTELNDGSSYMYTVTGLQPDVSYTFKVAAVNDAGVGMFASVSDMEMIKVTTTGGTTESSKTTSNTGNAGGASSPPSAVIGAVVAVLLVVVVIVLIIAAVIFYKRRKSHSKHGVSKDNLISLSSVSYKKKGHNDEDVNKEDKTESKSTDSLKASSVSKGAGSQGPSIEEFPQDTTVVEGQDVTFKVVVIGYPQPSLQWYHEDKEITTDYSRELDEHGNLYLPSCEASQSGVYKMVAKNSSGSIERKVQLNVLNETEAPPPKDVDLSPVPIMEFGTFVVNNHKNSNVGFKDLYEALDKGDNHATVVGFSPENKKLNRFANMTVYDDNRIVLKPMQAFTGGAQFINACYIDGYNAPKKFIATQGPLPHTLTDFWRLVLQEKVHTIVMVTNLKEGKKEKCHQYWPDTGSVDYGPINVAITDQQILADYTVRSFYVRVEDSTEQPLKVTQYHFTAWPDHGVPTYATSILAFHRRIKSQHKPKRGPMLVHCSAGVGRTGTFIAIDSIQEQVEKEKIIDIAGIVNKMRHQRMKMVQTQDQFMFIHDAILETVMCGDTQVDAANLRGTLMKMEKVDASTKKTTLQKQFEVLAQVSPSPTQSGCRTALRHSDKNRRGDYLPAENHRVILKGEFPDYINATNVDGYKQKRAYIIAEGPMDSTVRKFWKVISDRKCGVIVMCSDFVENGEESSCHYWPESGEKKFGEFNVVLLDQEECPGYTIRKLSVQMKKTPPQQVTQFQITNWDVDGSCSNLKSITDVIENVSIAQRRTGNHPIVVHCHDTVGRSGMFCAIMSTIERCKTEGVVDVFQVIKALRVQKPGAILNVEQYHLVFNAVLTYLDSFDTYANFQSM